jgi:beta-mannosidase
LLWAAKECVPLKCALFNAKDEKKNLKAIVRILDKQFKTVWSESLEIEKLNRGADVQIFDLPDFTIPERFTNTFFFIQADLNKGNDLISRSVYWPRCLESMKYPAVRTKQRAYPDHYGQEPPWPTLENGPWLKNQVQQTQTTLALNILKTDINRDQPAKLSIQVENTGRLPAFNTHLDLGGAKRNFYATDNYFWLMPGERKTIDLFVHWRENKSDKNVNLMVDAWNAKRIKMKLK